MVDKMLKCNLLLVCVYNYMFILFLFCLFAVLQTVFCVGNMFITIIAIITITYVVLHVYILYDKYICRGCI